MASAHASRRDARRAATSNGIGASHAAHHHGCRPVARYSSAPDSTAAPKRQTRLPRRDAKGRGVTSAAVARASDVRRAWVEAEEEAAGELVGVGGDPDVGAGGVDVAQAAVQATARVDRG